MKKLDLNKTLRTILLVLAIVLMLIKLINKASAADMPLDAYDYIVSYYDSHFSSSKRDEFLNYLESHPYFITYHFHSGYYERYFIELYNIEDVGIKHITSSSYYNGAGASSLHNLNGSSFYSFAFTANSNVDVTDKSSILYYASNTSMTPYRCYFGFNAVTSVTGFPNGSYQINSSSSDIGGNNPNFSVGTYSDITTFGNFYIQTGYNTYVYHETDYQKYTDTGFFNIWTSISQNDNKMLNITWDSSVFPSSGSMNYTKSVMDLTIEVNGTSQVVSFDSDDNPELFPTSSGTYIPYKFLQKVADLAEVSPSDSFYLTMVSLTQYAYPDGAPSSSAAAYNETSLCSVDLGELQPDVPEISLVQPVTINYTQVVNSSDFVVSSGSFSDPPSWVNQITIAYYDSSSGYKSNMDPNYPYEYFIGYNNKHVGEGFEILYAGGSDPSLDLSNIFPNLSITESGRYLIEGYDQFYIYNTLLPVICNYFDVVTIVQCRGQIIDNIYYNQNVIRHYYTASYYSKLNIKSLGNIQSAVEAGAYYCRALYDYGYTRFNGMAESLEKLRISNNALLGSINANIINLQGLVSSGTDRIVNALQGFSGGGLSVSDLSSTLNTLFMPSFDWDIVNYQDYLDSLGVLALPFEFVFDTQSIIKNNYSSTIILPINDFSVPLGKDFYDNDIQFTVFEDQENFEYDPTDIFPVVLWSIFQYLAAFGLVIGEAWFTYVHIFRKEEKAGDF